MKMFVLSMTLFGAVVAGAQSYPVETAEAQNLIATTDMLETYHYCIEGTLTCRTLVHLKSKATGQRVPDFYNVFLSSERAVGSTGYFIKNTGSNTYRASLDDVFNGVILINSVDPDNLAVSVTFDNKNMPTLHGLNLKRLGTTRYVVADMSFKKNEVTVVGFEYDNVNSAYKVPVNIVYKRVQR